MKRVKKEALVILAGISTKILSGIKTFLIWTITLCPIWAFLLAICLTLNDNVNETDSEPEIIEVQTQKIIVVYVDTPEKIIYTKSEEEEVESAILDVNYFAKCVEAEAGNQGDLGKRYVIDCILNRFESGKYTTIRDVINAPGQFSCVVNGDINSPIKQENIDLVYEEIQNRTNSEIKYFRTGNYHTSGTPCFQYGAHYFSK